MVMEALRDDTGKVIGNRFYAVPEMDFMGQGYPLTSYRPKDADKREQFVKWSCEPSFTTPYGAGYDDRKMFPAKIDSSIGLPSSSWPQGPPSKQKLASIEHFDPKRQFFKRGAHMPLMMYVGGSSQSRRTKAALVRRNAQANKRGWTWEKRHPTRGGGKPSQDNDDTRGGWEHSNWNEGWRGWDSDWNSGWNSGWSSEWNKSTWSNTRDGGEWDRNDSGSSSWDRNAWSTRDGGASW